MVCAFVEVIMLSSLQYSLCYSAYTYQALDADSMDMEIDLSNLGTVNTMFAALFRCGFLCMTACFQISLDLNYFVFNLVVASWVSLSRLPFQLMFLKKL